MTVNILTAHHFTKSQEAIMEASHGLSGTAIILGVGPGEDIPLEALARQFDQLLLVDCYMEAMEEAVETLPKELKNKCILHVVDLTGTVFKTREAIPSLLNTIPYPSHKEFTRGVQVLLRERVPVSFDEKASFICSSMVSSQLKRGDRFNKISQEFYDQEFPLVNELLALPVLHIEDLKRWVLPEGKIYYSDHFSVEILTLSPDHKSIHKEIDNDPMAPSILEKVDTLFKRVKQDSWDWYQGISETLYVKATITALTLSPKS